MFGVVEPEFDTFLGKIVHDALFLSDPRVDVVDTGVLVMAGEAGGPSTTIGGGNSMDLIDPAESDDEESPGA